jgi:hypothetical protein
MKRRDFLTTLAGGAALLLSGCAYGPGGYGPPPHAPAHGYRARHRKSRLVFDSRLGVYIVTDYPDYYYADGVYYRLRGGYWQIGGDLDGPWRDADRRQLPPGLRKRADDGRPRRRGRGRGRYD